MRFKYLLTKKQNSQKKRGSYKIIPLKLNYGASGIFAKKQFRFELLYLVYLKKYFKSMLKYNNFRNLNKKKIWIFLKPNYPLSKKGKNSRMGKGKGAFLRWAIKIYFNSSIFEFKNINSILVFKFLKKLNFITGNKFFFFTK